MLGDVRLSWSKSTCGVITDECRCVEEDNDVEKVKNRL
jgi:hypothetical protein